MPDKGKNVKIPTEEEISKLPRWAIVAFAARCARRVEPIFRLAWPDAPKKHIHAVADAIEVAEISASIASTAVSASARTAAAVEAAYAAARAATAVKAAYAAVEAAYVAARAAAVAITASAVEAANAAIGAGTVATREIRADYEKLLKASKAEKWTDATAVSPGFFGPLWPSGEPDWKKIISGYKKIKTKRKGDSSKQSEEGLSIQCIIPDNISAEDATEELVGLFHALSQYRIACGGNGLIIEDFQTFIKDEVLAGAGR